MVWPRPCTYGAILTLYVDFVKKHYGENTTIIFDGYTEELTTKGEEQRRRYSKTMAPYIKVEENIQISTSQDTFLKNPRNKQSFIEHLVTKFRAEGFSVKQAKDDADTLIINTSIEVALIEKTKMLQSLEKILIF